MTKQSLTNLHTVASSLCSETDLNKRKQCIRKLRSKDLNRLGNTFSALINQKAPFRVSPQDQARLSAVFKPYRKSIKVFVNKDLPDRRKALQKGGFFTALLAAVIPIIGELVTHLIAKYT